MLELDEDKIRGYPFRRGYEEQPVSDPKKQLSMDEKKAFEDYASPAEDSELSRMHRKQSGQI